MNHDVNRLMHGYFDETLTFEEFAALGEWIGVAPENAREFARLALLHDHLRNEFAKPGQNEPVVTPARRRNAWRGAVVALATTGALLALGFALWPLMESHPAAAAALELNRVIAASLKATDRTYVISVEEATLPDRQRTSPERDRPPKPPLHGARLYVRGPNQFVLERQVDGDNFFLTGSNGKVSWAVRPEGPVRVSSDLTRFNRDVPGHEHSMPLSNLHDGLEQLESAYDVQVMPVEEAAGDEAAHSEPGRLLVAVKKRGFRGPRRVEITYAATSGEIRQLRFVDMPYGPEQLTLRLTRLADGNLDPSFFNHEAHHAAARAVEFEE